MYLIIVKINLIIIQSIFQIVNKINKFLRMSKYIELDKSFIMLLKLDHITLLLI